MLYLSTEAQFMVVHTVMEGEVADGSLALLPTNMIVFPKVVVVLEVCLKRRP